MGVELTPFIKAILPKALTPTVRERQLFQLVSTLVRRDLKVKYRGSVLGYLWSMTNPLLAMTVMTLVFSFFVKGIPYYPLFVLSGQLFWNMAATAISLGAHSIHNGASLIRKVAVPIWIFPVVPVATFATNTLLAMIPYCIIHFAIDAPMPPSLWFMPVVFILYLMFLAGIALFVASLNVFFRDVGHIIEPILSLVMYGSGIFYDRAALPEKARFLIGLNPFCRFIEVWRKTVFNGSPVTLFDFSLLSFLAVASLTAGILIYRANSRKFIFHI